MKTRSAFSLALLPTFLLAAMVSAQEKRSFKLEPLSPKFAELIGGDAKLETVATGFGFTEGPMWDPSGFLYVSDETLNNIFRVYPDGRKEEVIALGDPDGNTFDRRHRLIDCASVLRAIIEVTPDGKYKVLADRYEGKRLNSPNDVIVGPDGEKFYVDDDEKRNIRVYDVATDGTLTHGRVFGEEPGGKGDGVPDGIKVDDKGNLFVTGPKGIWVWDANGNHLGTIVMPEQPANLTWGDPQYDTLYITATTSVYRLRTKTKGFVPYLQH